MSTGTGVTLYVGGVRFADGSPGDLPADPTALSGLSIIWGRDTTVDQPPPSTCSFSVMDAAGGTSFLDALHTGQTVEVEASSTFYPETRQAFRDPGFETDPLAVAVTYNASATATDRAAHSGGRSLRLDPADATRAARVVLPPAPVVPYLTDPSAWDDVPTTSPGQVWQVGAWVLAPLGAVGSLAPVLFSGPWASAVSYPDTAAAEFVGTGVWQFVTAPFDVGSAAGYWVGLDLTVYPTGQAWGDLDRAQTWAATPPAIEWDDLAGAWLDDLAVMTPSGGIVRTVLVFSGRITNMTVQYDDSTLSPRVDVTAADFTADLDNVDIGDEPWLAEPMGNRFSRILALTDLDVAADIDDTLAPFIVSWRDVDRQPATGLLQSLATSVDGVMWSAVHAASGAYLHVEDPSLRSSLYRLELADGVVVIVDAAQGGILSACDVLRDPITFVQDVNDVITRASVTWLEQTLDEDGNPAPTERTSTLIDSVAEETLGTRRISVQSELTTANDALDVASSLMVRLDVQAWRASGVTLDDALLAGGDTALLLGLLDGTRRIGAAIRIVDLPDWSPSGAELPLYVEGGSYRFDDGRWLLDLYVSRGLGQGESVAWVSLDPTWQWQQFDPGVSWAELSGVGPPRELEFV